MNALFYDLARNVSFILVRHESLFFKLEGGGVIFTKNKTKYKMKRKNKKNRKTPTLKILNVSSSIIIRFISKHSE